MRVFIEALCANYSQNLEQIAIFLHFNSSGTERLVGLWPVCMYNIMCLVHMALPNVALYTHCCLINHYKALTFQYTKPLLLG